MWVYRSLHKFSIGNFVEWEDQYTHSSGTISSIHAKNKLGSIGIDCWSITIGKSPWLYAIRERPGYLPDLVSECYILDKGGG